MLLYFFWNLILFVFALSILITVHECGHFLAARCFQVMVERVSIGFGPVLWKWRDSYGTEYVISAIFFGGYVKLFNDDQTEKNKFYKENTFNNKNIWKRGIIILSGPFFNLFFSVLSYILIFMVGIPTYKPIINTIIPYSIMDSYKDTLLPGSEIKFVNHVRTYDWESVRLELFNSVGKDKIIIVTSLENNVCLNTHTVSLPKNWFNDCSIYTKDPIVALGILPLNAKMELIISEIQENSPAKYTGFKIGDKIIAINGQPIKDWNSFTKIVKNSFEKKIEISIVREGKELCLCVIPNKKCLFNSVSKIEEEGSIGIIPKVIFMPDHNYVVYKYGFFCAIKQACIKTIQLTYTTINVLWKLIIGDIQKIHLGGPVSIAKGLGEAAQCGLIYYLMFLSLISINLSIFNLLPLPVLDGGHLLFLILEKINKKPVSKKIQDIGYIIGLIILISVMFLTLYNDVIYRL